VLTRRTAHPSAAGSKAVNWGRNCENMTVEEWGLKNWRQAMRLVRIRSYTRDFGLPATFNCDLDGQCLALWGQFRSLLAGRVSIYTNDSTQH
jgi:hypothetical protein